MPLSAPVARRHLHTRKVTCTGYFRDDGLFDLEGHITDEKTYEHEGDWRGQMRPGDYVHNMRIRLTLDRRLVIHDVEAIMDNSPYRICPDVTQNFRKLIGLRIAGGFHKKVHELVGGTQGCTHLVELLRPLATAAFQTISSDKAEELHDAWTETARAEGRLPPAEPKSAREARPPNVMNTCHSWSSSGPAIRQWYPEFYTGPDAEAVRAEAAAKATTGAAD